MMTSGLCLVYFFFQAEDGIRDHCVTGVQTCALPIFKSIRCSDFRRFLFFSDFFINYVFDY